MKTLMSKKVFISLLVVGIIEVTLPSAAGRQLRPETVSLSGIESVRVDQPIFTVLDRNGNAIDLKKGVSGGLLSGMKVTAGSGFRVRTMEVTLARGTSSMATIMTNGEMPDIRAWVLATGDRVIITITKVIKTSDKTEVGFENGIITIPIL